MTTVTQQKDPLLIDIEARRELARRDGAARAQAAQEEIAARDAVLEDYCGFVLMTEPLKLPGHGEPIYRFIDEISAELDRNMFQENMVSNEEVLSLTRITHAAWRQASLERRDDGAPLESGLDFLKLVCRRRKLPTPFLGGRPPVPLKQVRDRLARALKPVYFDFGRCTTMLEWGLQKEGLTSVILKLREDPTQFGRLRKPDGGRSRKGEGPHIRLGEIEQELTALAELLAGDAKP